MFGGLGDLAGLVKKAKNMQKDLKKVQKELAKKEFTAESGNGLVKITVTGEMMLKDIKISEECMKADAETLQDLVTAALSTALFEAKKESKDRLSGVTGGLGIDIPGLM